MKIFGICARLWDFLTGKSAYHNRALRQVKDWADTVKAFLSDYRLDAGDGTGYLVENLTRANVDLISLAYKGNSLVRPAAKIKGAPVSPLVVKLVDELENTRRAVMNPSLRPTVLPQVLSRLRAAFEALREKLSTVEPA